MSKEIIERLKIGEIPVDFDWNRQVHPSSPVPEFIPAEPTAQQIAQVKIVSEDLRDGLQGTSIYPDSGKMLSYVDALSQLGIDRMTVGIFSGKDNKMDKTVRHLLADMRDHYSTVVPIVLSLATDDSIEWAGECKQINPNLEAIVFMGTAPSRMLVQNWGRKDVLRKLAWATEEATVRHGINVIGATEHTTQTSPDFLKEIIKTQVESGAKTFCAADTIGTARPRGAYRLVKFVRESLDSINAPHVPIEWHGHRDKDNDKSNAMMAVAAGADRVHTVARGIGERSGNTKMESLLIDFRDILVENGLESPWDLRKLTSVLKQYDSLTEIAAPSHGALSEGAAHTSAGIHTDASNKAHNLAEEARLLGEQPTAIQLEEMASKIYTGVDPYSIGGEYTVGVSPWSGASTVDMAARQLGLDPQIISQEKKEMTLNTAKMLNRELTEAELRALLNGNTY